MDVVPHPVEIHGRINAVVLQQRDGHAGNGGSLHVWETALEHAQARDADNGLDLAGLDERHHDRAAFRHEDRVAETLGFILQILNRAKPALFAQQAEFIEGRGAFALHAQALRHEQEAALERHSGKLLAPEFVIDEHADVIAVDRQDAEVLHQTVRMLGEFRDGNGGRGRIFCDVIPHRVEDLRAFLGGLRDVLFGCR